MMAAELNGSKNCAVDSVLNLYCEKGMQEDERKQLNKMQQFFVNIYNKHTSYGFLLFVIVIHLYLIVQRCIELQDQNAAVIIAKLAGQLLHFDAVLVLLLILRRIITWLRTIGLDCILPLERNVHIHKMVGWTIIVFSFIHAVAHLANYGVISLNEKIYYSTALMETHRNAGLVHGTVVPTGFALFGILMIMGTFAHQKIRKSGRFELFYWTHFLYVPFFILLLIHARNAWKWLVVPLLLYAFEVINRTISIYFGRGKTDITLINTLPNDVVHLRIRRPDDFEYQCGDWLFINIPQVAKYEWHAFTISSEPEALEYLTLHIRVVGGWTGRLKTLCKTHKRVLKYEECLILQRESRLSVLDRTIQEILTTHKVDIPVRLDGPYAGSTTSTWNYEHCVYVAGGIGVTPFASLLQSIMRQFKDSMTKCANCSHSNCSRIPASMGKLKHVEFLWVNRHLLNFKWFLQLLLDLEEEKKAAGDVMENFFNIRLYQTGKTDVNDRPNLIRKCDSVNCADPWKSLVTCNCKLKHIKHLLKFGRPDWDKVFTQVKDRNLERVCVFYCGPTSMGVALKEKCKKFGFSFVKELS